jgi:hypothetical protein
MPLNYKGSANEKTPDYYVGKNGLTPIDLIDAFDMSFAQGCVIKYVSRYQGKDGLKDLKKARANLDWLIENMEKAELVAVAEGITKELLGTHGIDVCVGPAPDIQNAIDASARLVKQTGNPQAFVPLPESFKARLAQVDSIVGQACPDPGQEPSPIDPKGDGSFEGPDEIYAREPRLDRPFYASPAPAFDVEVFPGAWMTAKRLAELGYVFRPSDEGHVGGWYASPPPRAAFPAFFPAEIGERVVWNDREITTTQLRDYGYRWNAGQHGRAAGWVR